ncbi:hypothetical protein H8S90_13930 [Olivibacter sp. SDN3]|uniref:hypothetical protein n=1 Tax=Olivibacter sp. SDN3 TaxID=2764720 RepID=UPI0016516FCF|nr:hypothetical protein [Olivibacter sp. SDN3]QNL47918.1 hypothetical protein H8S90_13930 [Olivibacter sp. SDN3]
MGKIQIIIIYFILGCVFSAFAQNSTDIPVNQLMNNAIPENAVAVSKSDGYNKLIKLDPDQAFDEESIGGEFYIIDSMIIVFYGGKAEAPYKPSQLEETRATLLEMGGMDTSHIHTDNYNKISKLNNFKVLTSFIDNSTTSYYYLIADDRVSYLNFSITAKPEDQAKAKALGESMLKNMRFK